MKEQTMVFQHGHMHNVPAINELGEAVKRTKESHPYSYDGFVSYRNGENKEVTGTIYSDRLLQWDNKLTRKLMQKHFGTQGDYYSAYEPRH